MWQKFFEYCLMMWKEMVILSDLTHETNPFFADNGQCQLHLLLQQ